MRLQQISRVAIIGGGPAGVAAAKYAVKPAPAGSVVDHVEIDT